VRCLLLPELSVFLWSCNKPHLLLYR
jgi:hypothetical protein